MIVLLTRRLLWTDQDTSSYVGLVIDLIELKTKVLVFVSKIVEYEFKLKSSYKFGSNSNFLL